MTSDERVSAAPCVVRGFTLLELLVAIFISAVMFSLGYAALNQAATQRDRLQQAQHSLGAMQRTMRYLSQDFAQLAPRPVRDELGRSVESALVLDPRQTAGVTLTRGGQSLTIGEPRGRLLRVRYLIEGDRLIRLSTPILDRTPASPEWRRQELLRNVSRLDIRALDQAGSWHDVWPLPPLVDQAPNPRSRPRAIEVRLGTRDRGELRRVIEVTG